MKSSALSDTLAGALALACAAAVVLATALDARARLGPPATATTAKPAPVAVVPGARLGR